MEMIDLNLILKRHSELEQEILPSVVAENFTKYIVLLKEYEALTPLVTLITDLNIKKEELEAFSEMYEFETDESSQKEIANEMQSVTDNVKALEEQIEKLISSLSIFEQKETPVSEEVGEPTEKSKEENITQTEIGRSRGRKNFEDSIKKLQPKVWSLIRDNWINAISYPIDPNNLLSGEDSISNLPEFERISNEIIVAENTTPLNHSLGTVFKKKISSVSRELTLRQALYSFHKASHIISSGELHAELGVKSWSLASCYQGAYLAAKTIINLFGISINEYKGQQYLVDVWQTSNTSDPEIEVGIIRYSFRRIEHRHIWQLAKRIISSSTVDIWNERYVQALKATDFENFPKQRNTLQYLDQDWLFEDLHEFEIDSNFGVYPQGLEYGLQSFLLKSDFTLVYAQMILKLAYDLIKDISSITNLISQDFKLLDNFISKNERHPIFIQNHNEFKKKAV